VQLPGHPSDLALLEAIVRSATDYAIITLGPDNVVMSWTIKYGALASPQGRLDVSWQVRDNLLALEWRESGFAASREAGRGYRRELIEVALPFVGADTHLEFLDDGIYCSIQLPSHEWNAEGGSR
jgi:hypothetical protein